MNPDHAYRVTAAFFAELAGHGLADVVISPGSRSTPLTLTAHSTVGLRTHVIIDERVAGFFALGLARSTQRPVALVCTSGTAAANYLPAVIEANHSRVPLIICTADRPPELRDRGSAQTIDQVGLYGSHPRWFVDLPVASDVDPAFARRVAARALAEAGSHRPGPVHCNWPLREPLIPDTWTADSAQPDAHVSVDRPERVLDAAAQADLATMAADTSRGLVVVGPGDLSHGADAIARLSEATGWPVLAEATSSVRTGPHTEGRAFLSYWDLLVRDQNWIDAAQPDLVVRFGGPPTNKALRLWLERQRPPLVVVDPGAAFDDPTGVLTRIVAVDVDAAVSAMLSGSVSGDAAWTGRWTEADARLGQGVTEVLGGGPLLEAGVVAALDRALPADAVLVVSNSMPVRDVDGYLPAATRPLRVLANRGAAGIDGVVSTAFGVAGSGATTLLLIGDVALAHDIGGLHAGLRAGLDLSIVVPDNGGGGIFSFLPIADRNDVDFEELFLTPSCLDWDGLAAHRGVRVHHVDNAAALTAQVEAALVRPGVDIVRVAVDREANVAQHGQLAALVDGW